REHAEVIGAAPYVEAQLMLVNGEQVTGALARGVLPEFESDVSDIEAQMVVGSLDALQPGEFNAVLGASLAHFLDVTLGDKVTVVAPEASVNVVGVTPRMKRFTVVGTFSSGMGEYDRNMAVFAASDAARLLRMDGLSGVRLKLEDMFNARSVAKDLAETLGETWWVSDWTWQHRNFFRAVQTEKTMMFIILSLIVAVAAFNIVSMLIMVVNEKQSDIAILRTLGASPGSVMRIFLVQGTVIGLFGTLLGLIGGVSLALNVERLVPMIESLLGRKFLAEDVYAISYFPSELKLDDVMWVTVIAFCLTVGATLYPAWRAARTDPVEALRHD
ncbi:MAG: lipoprotein-releasing ABC transporter permease subunit, partial [Pseudomonadota bacterium]